MAPSARSTTPTRCRHAATGAGLALRGLDASVELGLDDELVVLTAGGPTAASARSGRRSTSRRLPGYGATRACRGPGPARRDPDGRETLANGDALVRALEVIDAAYDSARTGRTVRLA